MIFCSSVIAQSTQYRPPQYHSPQWHVYLVRISIDLAYTLLLLLSSIHWLRWRLHAEGSIYITPDLHPITRSRTASDMGYRWRSTPISASYKSPAPSTSKISSEPNIKRHNWAWHLRSRSSFVDRVGRLSRLPVYVRLVPDLEELFQSFVCGCCVDHGETRYYRQTKEKNNKIIHPKHDMLS